ncbi:acyltransferase [Roseomonas sp. KE2513]|uniref:acyltransferase family protein n=1 Tax=Roseomonas sp. KE2513 TaxID=2479202 RepID=UPI0018DF5D2F|nr:acyltransferase [Roseomonas sp. KE2513]MBI0534094.1 acyltransferase [Roseomonas sp. KE2513]
MMLSNEVLVLPGLLALGLAGFRWRRRVEQGCELRPPLGGKLTSIQAARGFAAMLVAIYHLERLTQPDQYLGRMAFDGVFGFGHAGVDFFFVLSGFIIYYVHHRDLGVPAALSRFVWRRATRIYPAYWLVTAFVILTTALVVPHWTDRFPIQHVLGSLILLPQATEPVLTVGWTLVHEVVFYVLFAIGIASRRVGSVVVLTWLAIIVAGTFIPPEGLILRHLASNYNLLFMIGLLTAHIVLRVSVSRPLLWALGGFCALLGAGWTENAGLFQVNDLTGRLLYGFSSMAIIIGLAAAERTGRLRVGRTAMFLGDVSYALYLVHVTVIANTLWLLAKSGMIEHVPVPVLAAGTLTASIAAAAVIHLKIERPVLRWAQGGRASNGTRTVPVAASQVATGTS